MVGVEVHDVFVLVELLRDVGEQLTDRAVNIACTVQKLLLIDLRIRQTDTGDAVLHLIEPVGERERCLHRQIEFVPFCIIRMYV